MLHVLLLDMDDVLLEQVAYHQSLKDCVERIGRWCGFPSVGLTDHAIAVFEAHGVTSEWDSAAICAALLLDRAWTVDPSYALPDSPDAPAGRFHELPVPDFEAFISATFGGGMTGIEARRRTQAHLLHADHRTAAQRAVVEGLLRHAYDGERSLTNRIIQELTLGAEEYEACYGRPAAIPGPGYLRTLDPPLISPLQAAQLVAWNRAPGKRAVVFTNRPSLHPVGRGGTPEAEIGLARIGLSALPFVSMGHLDWLCAQRGLEPQTLLKPSPVHALAALRMAAGDALTEALATGAALALDGTDTGGWRRLDGAQVLVFEDSFRGLQSARGAQQLLKGIDVLIQLDLRGIARHDVKRRALEQAGGAVYPDFTAATRDLLGEAA